jgi:hypothetical protein
MLRSLSAAVLALAICACEPSLPQVTPTPTVTAVFDPTASKIPLPNDLVFLAPVTSVCPASANGVCAQAELLAAFKGRFPSDQEVAITIDFTENTYENGRLKQVAPDLDVSTITPATLFVVGSIGGTVGPVPLDPITPADYVIPPDPMDPTQPSDHGTLTLHHLARTPWSTGSYTLVMRGGDMGVKTKDSIPVTSSPVFDLIEQGKDMTLPENLGLLKAQNNGSTMDALAQGVQLNALIGIYKNTAFPAADHVGRFPHEQMAIASTFQIDATVTNVAVDPARGLAPLPFDLLRDPTSHKLTPTAACALVGSALDSTGKCPNPAAAGFQTLDGFSTTGAVLAPTSDLIDGATVTGDTLKLYDLTDPRNPALVDASTLIIEPCEFTAQFNGTACDTSLPKLAPAIAFQPAGATTGDPTSVFRTRPLKDNTDYAVVLTTDIKDKAGNAIGPGTVAKVLQFKNALYVSGHSALQGIDDTTALSLETMRKQLAPVIAKLPDASKVAMAYTFHTQTVLSTATDLGAFPYSLPPITALPISPVVPETAAAAFTKYGVVPTIPSSNIDEILEVDITTLNLLDPATGAFKTDPKQAVAEPIHVLIATPKAAAAPACQGPLAPFGHCAPLAVYGHGLGRGRAELLLIADSLTAKGMVAVAIDAAKHGDRTLCSSAAPAPLSGCNGTTPPDGKSHCISLPNAANQGDTAATGGPPGTCDSTGLIKAPVTPGATGNPDGIAAASGNYVISANFFRTRDTFRQDLIDESQLIRAIAFVPDPTKALPPNSGHAVIDHMVQRGVIIDPGTIYFSGQSLGSFLGPMDVATNPRITRAAFNVGGGTIVDVFATSPVFHDRFTQLIGSLGITPGTAQFIQFLTVAKTVLDPADPINFMGHLTDPAHMLPNLLPPLGGNPNGTVPQLPKQILTQFANCDGDVTNPFNFLYASNAGLGPVPNPTANPPTSGTIQLFLSSDGPTPTCPTGGGVSHAFLLDFSKPAVATAAQADLASFLKTGQNVPSIEHP